MNYKYIVLVKAGWFRIDYMYTKDGKYEFKDMIPGQYRVKFTYGDYEYIKDGASVNATKLKHLISPKIIDGKQVLTMYTGQDYESTIFNVNGGIDQRITEADDISVKIPANFTGQQEYTVEELKGGYIDLDKVNGKDEGSQDSDAEDDNDNRVKVNDFAATISYEKGIILDVDTLVEADGTVTTIGLGTREVGADSRIKEMMDNTKMNAYTPKFLVEVETKSIADIDLGLIERPRFNLELKKVISAVKFTLADGQIKEYASLHGTTSAERKKVEDLTRMDDTYLIQINEELMHGATIEIEYEIVVTNTGDVNGTVNKIVDYIDYDNNSITFRGDGKLIGNLVGTNAADYGWTQKKPEDLVELSTDPINGITYKLGVDKDIADKLDVRSKGADETLTNTKGKRQYVETEYLNDKEIAAHSESSNPVKLVVSKAITETMGGDELSYRNSAEIVQYSSTIGRRIYGLIPGNFDPTEPDGDIGTPERDKKYEKDSDTSPRLSIIPPLGDPSPLIYYIIAGISLVILAAGIIIIKKKVLK